MKLSPESVECLERLLSRCKCGVYVSINGHRDFYDKAKDYLDRHDIDDEIRQEMIARDTIVEVHFYPNTPITYWEVWHYDLDAALKLAGKALESEAKP